MDANESLDVPGPMLKKYFRQRIPKPLPTQNIGAQFDMRYAAGHLSTKLRGTRPFKGVEEKKWVAAPEQTMQLSYLQKFAPCDTYLNLLSDGSSPA